MTSSIVCGIDGSPDARSALRTAAQLSGQLGLRLVVAHIVKARLNSTAGSIVGSRGRGAFKAAFLGSVSTDLIGVARRPVLVVPPGTAHGEPPHASRTTIGAIGDRS